MKTVNVFAVRYQWSDGARISIDPDAAGREIDRIAERDGEARPEVIVQESRRKGAPLHDHFTWDDKEAAEQHRIGEARYLVRHLMVVNVRPDTEEELPATRAFVVVPSKETDGDGGKDEHVRSYVPVWQVMNDDGLRARYIERALHDLESWRKRYADIVELAGLFEHVDREVEKLKK